MGMGKDDDSSCGKKYVELEAWAVPLFYLSFPNSTNKQTPRIVTLCKQFVFMMMMMMVDDNDREEKKNDDDNIR